MKRIKAYRTLFNSAADSDLKTLKNTYRTLVKEWHPDKFQADDEKFAEAELKSQEIIDAYHFLVSMAPETRAANRETFEETVTTAGMNDFKYKGQVLEVSFGDGATYEFFGVSKAIYGKLLNSDNQWRFAKRNIFNSYQYRMSKKTQEVVA